MPCQDCFHWQTRDSSLVIILFQPPYGVASLGFPTRSSVAPTFYVVLRRSQKQVVFKNSPCRDPKGHLGNSLLTLHRLHRFLRDDDSWRNEHSKGSLPDAGEEEAVRLPSVRLLCALSSNASVCTSICKA